MGLMIGIELTTACNEIRSELLHEYKIFTGASSNKNTLRILPALNITKVEADLFLDAFKKVMSKSLINS
jgi:acetylornithine aminotransferase